MKHRLSLAYQGVTAPPSDVIRNYGASIVEMDLSYNKVSDLRFLTEMPALESLVLDHNHINAQVKIPSCPSLEILWVNHNKIENLGLFVATVAKSCPNLRILSMMNNLAAPSYFNGGTFQQYMDYRYFVISNLPRLEAVDDRPITPEERSEARRLYPVVLVGKSRKSGRNPASMRKRKSKGESSRAPPSSQPRASPSSSSASLSASASTSGPEPPSSLPPPPPPPPPPMLESGTGS